MIVEFKYSGKSITKNLSQSPKYEDDIVLEGKKWTVTNITWDLDSDKIVIELQKKRGV